MVHSNLCYRKYFAVGKTLRILYGITTWLLCTLYYILNNKYFTLLRYHIWLTNILPISYSIMFNFVVYSQYYLLSINYDIVSSLYERVCLDPIKYVGFKTGNASLVC